MGQAASLPTPKLPGRKHNRAPVLREYSSTGNDADDRSSLAYRRRSSFGGRLRSFAALLHRTPSPKNSTDEQVWEQASIPSSVENDVISSAQRPSWWFADAGSTFFDALASSFAWDRSFAALTPTSRRPTTPVTPSSLSASLVRVSPVAGGSDALVPVFSSSSRLGNSRLGPSTMASLEILHSSSPMVRHQRLPNLRLGELEQIFAAIVTSDGQCGRTKLPLSG